MEGAQKVRDGSHPQSGICCSPNGCDSSEEQTKGAETAIDLDGWNMLRLGQGSEAEKQYKGFRYFTACQNQNKRFHGHKYMPILSLHGPSSSKILVWQIMKGLKKPSSLRRLYSLQLNPLERTELQTHEPTSPPPTQHYPSQSSPVEAAGSTLTGQLCL